MNRPWASIGRVAAGRRSLGLFLDRGRIEQRGDDCRRSDADRYSSLHKLGTPFAIAPVIVTDGMAASIFCTSGVARIVTS